MWTLKWLEFKCFNVLIISAQTTPSHHALNCVLGGELFPYTIGVPEQVVTGMVGEWKFHVEVQFVIIYYTKKQF